MVEGTFARIFRSGLRPVELGRRLVREMDDGRSVDVRGRTVVPNDFTVCLDRGRLRSLRRGQRHLCRELAEAAREHARDEGYHFLGPVQVDLDGRRPTNGLVPDRPPDCARHPVGRARDLSCCRTAMRIALGAHPVVHRAALVLRRHLADPNVSRHHAEIRPPGDGYVLVDLGSTNGSRIKACSSRSDARRRRRDPTGQHHRRLRGLLTGSAGAKLRTGCRSGRVRSQVASRPVSEPLLNVLQLLLLVLLYLFFFRVLRAVWVEVKAPPPATEPSARKGGPGGRRPGTEEGPPAGGGRAARDAEPGLRSGRGGHHRAGSGVWDHGRRHLRVAGACPGLPPTARSWSRIWVRPTARTSTVDDWSAR